MPVSPTPGSFRRAGLVALLVTVVWAMLAARSPAMPPVFPLGPQPVYSSTDAPLLVAIEPVLHAAWLASPPRPVVWLVALLVLAGACGVAIFSGASTLSAALVVFALVLDPSFGAALAHSSWLVVSVGLVWLAAGASFDDRPHLIFGRAWFNPLSTMVLWALAVWCDWIAIVAWPVVWAAFRRTPHRPARGWWTSGSLVLGAGAFVACFAGVAGVAETLTAGLPATLGWRDAIAVAFDARPRMPTGSFAAPELTTRLGSLLMALAAVGVGFGLSGRWWRRTTLLSAVLAVGVGVGWPAWQAEVLRFSLWALAPLAAAGLTWVARQGHRPRLITSVLGAIAISETLVSGARPLEGRDARVFRDALQEGLDRRLKSAPLLVVAEDTRIDSALVPWLAATAGRAQRAPQDGDIVARGRNEGRTVLAGPTGRRHLELAGVSFAEAFAIAEPAPFVMSEVDATFQCAEVRADRWSHLPGLAYTGRLGLELPPQPGGEIHLVVGDALALPLRVESPDGREIVPRLEPLSSGPGASPPPADYWIDDGGPDAEPRWIRRVRLPSDPFRATLMSLYLGRRAPRVIARLEGYGDRARGRVCAAPLGAVFLRGNDEAVLPLEEEAHFGTGWYGREGHGRDAFRWADAEAVTLMRSAVRAEVDVDLVAEAAASLDEGETTVTLRVNGVELGTRVMRAGDRRYTWRAPAGVWLAGTNELWWRTSRSVRPADRSGSDTRSLALRVKGVSVGLASRGRPSVGLADAR